MPDERRWIVVLEAVMYGQQQLRSAGVSWLVCHRRTNFCLNYICVKYFHRFSAYENNSFYNNKKGTYGRFCFVYHRKLQIVFPINHLVYSVN